MLSSDARANIDAFKAFTIAHPKLLKADREIRAFVQEPAGTGVLLVAGPTGVGKTTLLNRVITTLSDELTATPVLGAHGKALSAPVAFVTPPGAGGSFSWADWLIAANEALGHPSPREIVNIPENPRVPISRGARTIGDLKRPFVAAALDLQPGAIAVDEAHHLTLVGQGQRLLAQLEMIKSLADATGRPFLLFGTYDLLVLRNLSGQLGRRCMDLNFSRYDIADTAEWSQFRSALYTFAQQLPIKDDLLLANAEWVYARSAGCVGTLKQWLTRALVDAFDGGSPEILREHLERKALSVQALTAIAKEIAIGEQQFEETRQEIADLEGLLGITPRVVPPKSKPRPRRPGRRSPVRDPIEEAA
jgi:Type II/IV secretion system protein.